MECFIRYVPKIHPSFVLCCALQWFVIVWLYLCLSGILHWHWHQIVPVPVKQHIRIWVNNAWRNSTRTGYIATEKESTTKRRIYFMGGRGMGQCPDIHLVVATCKISKTQYFYLHNVSHFHNSKMQIPFNHQHVLYTNHSSALLTHWGLVLTYVDLDLGQRWSR